MTIYLLKWASFGAITGWCTLAGFAWLRHHRMRKQLLLDIRHALRKTSWLVLLGIASWVVALIWDHPLTAWQFIMRVAFIAAVAAFWGWQHGWLDPGHDEDIRKGYTYPPAGGKRKLS